MPHDGCQLQGELIKTATDKNRPKNRAYYEIKLSLLSSFYPVSALFQLKFCSVLIDFLLSVLYYVVKRIESGPEMVLKCSEMSLKWF